MKLISISMVMFLSVLLSAEQKHGSAEAEVRQNTQFRPRVGGSNNFSLQWIPTFVSPGTEDITALRKFVEGQEQVCIGNGPLQEEGAARQRDGFLDLLKEIEPKLRPLGIVTQDPPENWEGKEWDGLALWKEKIEKLEKTARCDALQLAYIYAIARVSSMEGSVKVEKYSDILFSKLTPEIINDRRKASWVFRYVHFLDQSLYPAECKDVKEETTKRWNFIVKENRLPLGYALHMCGRPMNAHYLDFEVLFGNRPKPDGWEK